MFTSVNPYTNQIVGNYAKHTDYEVKGIIEESAKCQNQWKNSTLNDRLDCIKKIADVLSDFKEELALLVTDEMGKPITEAYQEIDKCITLCDYYIENSQVFLQPKSIATEATYSGVEYHPLGTVFGIMPWNFPVWQVFRFAIPALVAGNTVVLKHAPNVIGTAQLIERIFEKALPENTFRLLKITHDQVELVISHDAVQFVSFTGSEAGGSIVAQLAAKYIKRSVLELGGSNAFVILDDANLEKAAVEGAKSRLLNTGQSCIAAKRFIVQTAVAKQFQERLVKEFMKYEVSNPKDLNTKLGVVARADLSDKLEAQIKTAISEGAQLVVGGERNNNAFLPTILSGITREMWISQEEIFGPVALLYVVDSDQEAVSLVNNTRFGLGVSVYTTNQDRANYFIKEARDGAVFVNSMVFSNPRLPFGGTKKSGYGRELAELGLKEFVNVKTVFWK